jgi:hypothetical protein
VQSSTLTSLLLCALVFCAHLQGLVAQFASMVTALGASADAAATKFDQQKSAATTLAASMQDSITSMREAAALAEQLQAKYVEQTVMLDAATGGIIEDWSCSRTLDWEVGFAVHRAAAAAGAAGATRRLLQSDADGSAAGDQLTLWQGYQLDVADKNRNWMVDETDAPEQARYVGAAPGHNKLVAGLFMHSTRKLRTASCSGTQDVRSVASASIAGSADFCRHVVCIALSPFFFY